MRQILLIAILMMSLVLSAEWTVVETFTVPEGAAGLAWDGEYLYCGIYGVNGDYFYRIDPADGSWEYVFSVANLGDCFGLTYDGTHLWTTDHPGAGANPAIAYELDMNGNILSQFNLPDHYMSGIAYDNGDFWVSTYYDPDGYIYRLDGEGNILQSFAAPDNQPWDLCLENEYLWMADYWGDALYKIDPVDGSLIESHDSEGVDPSGIVYDGEYLWYCDNGQGTNQDYLYKVDLTGGGMPVIELGFDEYDFGELLVGEFASVDLPVYNNGTADLHVTSVDLPSPQFSAIFQPPLVVTPGGTGYIGIMFEPDEWGNFEAIMEIGSDDPIHPLMEVNLSGSAIYEDPDIEVSVDAIDFGTVRVGGCAGEQVEISNHGQTWLWIEEIYIMETNYHILVLEDLPIVLGANTSYLLNVWFEPTSATTFTGELIIPSNDPDENPYIVALTGEGEYQNFTIGETVWEYQITGGFDNSPKSIIALPDVNGDDKDDVVISSEDDYIRCLNGNSSDWADVIWEIELGSVYSQAGLAVNINWEDLYDDVVVGTAWGDRSIYLLSGRNGEVIWERDTHEYGEGGWVYAVSSKYDHNGDWLPDVLAAAGNDSYNTGPQRVYCLDYFDGSTIWEYYAPGTKFSVLEIEDVNNDGIHDVVAGGSNIGETEGIVYGIDGADGSELWTYTTAGSSVWALEQLGDINGDGVADVIAGDFAGNYYGLDATNGGMIWSGNIGTAIILRFAQLDDVNSDGYPDISVAHSSFHNAVVLDGYTGAQIWSQPVVDQPWNLSRIDDISGDGINDLIVGTLYSNSYIYYLSGTDGSEIYSINVGTPLDAVGVIHDVDGNGSMEVIAGGRDGSVYCYSGGVVSLGMIEGYVYDSNMQPLQGVMIQTGGYSVITDMMGYFMMQLPPGAYELTVNLAGYYSVTLNVVVIENEVTTLEIILEIMEEIYPPENVIVDEGGYVSWNPPAGRPLEGYNIYQEGVLVGQTEETFFQLTGLVFQLFYNVGVSALYTTGESEIIETGFIYTGFHRYGDIDDNGNVEAYDAAIILQYVVGLDPTSAPLPWVEWQIAVTDVDGNGEVEAYDAALVLQYVVGIIEIFPVELPVRYNAPEAEIDVYLLDNSLVFYARENLYAFTLQFDNESDILLRPQLTCKKIQMAFNEKEYRLAMASAEAVEGEFLRISLNPNADLPESICLSLVINVEQQERNVVLQPENSFPAVTELIGNYPNPFNPETTINFFISEGDKGELSIFNIKGQILEKKTFEAGWHNYRWLAEQYGSGIYFCRLISGNICETRKMVMIR